MKLLKKTLQVLLIAALLVPAGFAEEAAETAPKEEKTESASEMNSKEAETESDESSESEEPAAKEESDESEQENTDADDDGGEESESADEGTEDDGGDTDEDDPESEDESEDEDDPEESDNYSIVMMQGDYKAKSSYTYTTDTDTIQFSWLLYNNDSKVSGAEYQLTIEKADGTKEGPTSGSNCTLTASKYVGANKFTIEAYLNGTKVKTYTTTISFKSSSGGDEEYSSYQIKFTYEGEDLKTEYTITAMNTQYTVNWVLYGDNGHGLTPITDAVYSVTITKADNSVEGPLSGSSYTFAAAQYIGENTISVEAAIGSEQVCNGTAKITFKAGGQQGGMPSGGASAATAAGAGSEEEQGIVPGEALIDTHASGTKDMTPYTAVEPVEEETGVVLENTGAEITLDRGIFTVESDANEMKLDSVTDGSAWTFTGLTLKTLKKAGVDKLQLGIGGQEINIDTDTELSGYYYGKLRSQGLVSSDFIYNVTADGMTVTVRDTLYTVDENGELQPVEG